MTLHIYIDADACPVKEEAVRIATRYSLPITFVSNSVLAPLAGPTVRQQVVSSGLDVADDWIVDNVQAFDIVVTADIPLAAILVEKGVVAIDPRGTIYAPSNVKEALATRNLMQELRESGLAEGGPAPLGPKDRERFTNALDRELTRLRRRGV